MMKAYYFYNPKIKPNDKGLLYTEIYVNCFGRTKQICVIERATSMEVLQTVNILVSILEHDRPRIGFFRFFFGEINVKTLLR